MIVANTENILKTTVEFMVYDKKKNCPANDMSPTEEMSFIVLSHGNLGLLGYHRIY